MGGAPWPQRPGCAAGLRYPQPHWTYQEAASLWTACAGGSGGTPRAGVSLFFQAPFAQINWWMHAWGVAEMAPGRTASLMASPQGVACLTWIQDLVRNKVAIPRGGMNLLAQGQCVFKQSGGWELLPAAQQLSNRVKWDILPSPTWPAGRSTFNNIDFYGLNAASRHPDQAWELLRWVCAEPDYQRFQMRVTLVQPCLLNLWREWEATVQSVAPPLRGKQLHWLHNAEAEGYAWPNVFFKYAASEADTLVDQWLTEIWNGQVSPELGLRQLSAQLAALERGGATETAAAAGTAKAFPSQGAPIAEVTPGV